MSGENLEIRLGTLTPLWAGGVAAGKVDRIHETGILGSLRWWYEAIVRGLGGEACDPSTGKCRFDAEAYEKSQADDERQRLRDAGLCDVCQVFGATGWRRRFRLEVMQDKASLAWTPPPDTLNIRPPEHTRGWYLPPGWVGQITLRLTGDDQTLALLTALLRFLERHGAIGAKPQLGYGVFRIIDIEGALQRPWVWPSLGLDQSHPTLPDLRRFGFFNYRFTAEQGWWSRAPGLERLLGRSETARALQQLVQQGMIPVAPLLKDAWRFGHWNGPRSVELYLFGTSRDPRVRSKLNVSWAYPAENANNWEVRGWVWLPEQDDRDVPFLQQVWQNVRDVSIWQTVLKTDHGALTCFPDASTWQAWAADSVRNFLEEAS